MENRRSKKEIVLLPRYFKIIGLVVILLAIVPMVVIKALSMEMLPVQKELLKQFTANAFILGLLFIAWSMDKLEDEMTFSIRLKAMSIAFITAVCILVINPFFDLLFKDPIENETGHSVVIKILLFYFLGYYFLKNGVLFPKKEQVMKNSLKVERAKLDLTQQDLANKVGVSRQTINSIEAERYVPSTVLAIKISDVFKVNVNEIFKLEKDD